MYHHVAFKDGSTCMSAVLKDSSQNHFIASKVHSNENLCHLQYFEYVTKFSPNLLPDLIRLRCSMVGPSGSIAVCYTLKSLSSENLLSTASYEKNVDSDTVYSIHCSQPSYPWQ